ncbi:MAG: MerR family transcriptional regulator, partial [Clostridiales bacterium]|nr:MerR family transcriptional regulator [Clostridiales bacterium]
LYFFMGGVPMTITEASGIFNVSCDVLREYENNGLLKKTSETSNEYCEEDFNSLGLIQLLSESGLAYGEIKEYLDLTSKPGTEEQQISILRKLRYTILNSVHKNQKMLDKIDFIIWNKKKEESL